MPTAHTDPSATYYLLHAVIGNGAMNKFGSCSPWRRKSFTITMLFFSVGNGAMNASRYWQLRDDACIGVETCANIPRFSYPYCALNFMANSLANTGRILIANCTIRRLIFKRLSQDEGQTDFSKNLRASPFNDDLSRCY